MTLQTLSDRDLQALVRYGSDERRVAQARAELALRGSLRAEHEPHKLVRAGASPAPATTSGVRSAECGVRSGKGRWDTCD